MGMILYIIAAILIIIWIIGFFFYSLGAMLHVLLVLALMSILISIVQERD